MFLDDKRVIDTYINILEFSENKLKKEAKR